MLFVDAKYSPKDYVAINDNPIYQEKNWTIVGGYDSFVKYVEAHGIPDVISVNQSLEESTDFAFIAWLREYAQKWKRDFPEYLLH